MPLVVGVHEITQQFNGSNVLRDEWLLPLCDGLGQVDVVLSQDDDLACALYGNLLRKPGIRIPG